MKTETFGSEMIVSSAQRSVPMRRAQGHFDKTQNRDAPSLYSFSVIHGGKGRHLGRLASDINRTVRPRSATQRDRKGRGVPPRFPLPADAKRMGPCLNEEAGSCRSYALA